MQRWLASVTIVMLGACTPGRAAMVVGGGTMLYGAAAIGAGAATSVLFTPLGDEHAGDGIAYYGLGFLAAGAVITALGIAMEASGHDEPAARCTTCDAPEPVTAPALALDERAQLNVRIARQTKAHAHAGECEAARESARLLGQLAPATQEALVRVDAEVARCLDERGP